MAFQAAGYNRLLYVGLNPVLAAAHRLACGPISTSTPRCSRWWLFFRLAVGVLLVTALLIVPAAAARNLARSAGGMFWWALLVGSTSAVIGL